jgi:hypothetical protein
MFLKRVIFKEEDELYCWKWCNMEVILGIAKWWKKHQTNRSFSIYCRSVYCNTTTHADPRLIKILTVMLQKAIKWGFFFHRYLLKFNKRNDEVLMMINSEIRCLLSVQVFSFYFSFFLDQAAVVQVVSLCAVGYACCLLYPKRHITTVFLRVNFNLFLI